MATPMWRNGRRNGLKIRSGENRVWVRIPSSARSKTGIALLLRIGRDPGVRLTGRKWPDEKTASTARDIQRHESVALVGISIVSR